MKATPAQQEALLGLIHRIYQEIRTVEEENRIQVSAEDFRPRIDYFHDVVQAFTQNPTPRPEAAGRLAVESLAHDIVMLRQIQENPRLTHPDLPIPLSASTAVIPRPQTPARERTRMDGAVATHLSQGYGHYALLFAALLSHPAERNYLTRVSDCNDQANQLTDILHTLKQAQPDAPVDIDATLAEIDDPALKQKILAALNVTKKQKQVSAAYLQEALRQQKETLRSQISALEAAHMRYASSQLVMYQEAQPIVKKMAMEGLNIVGEFVASAVREAQRGGRGM